MTISRVRAEPASQRRGGGEQAHTSPELQVDRLTQPRSFAAHSAERWPGWNRGVGGVGLKSPHASKDIQRL